MGTRSRRSDPHRPSIGGESGFGLVDFLLALALGSMLMLAIGSVFQTGFQAVRASTESTVGNDAVQGVLQWITRDAHGGAPDDQVACVVATPTATCPQTVLSGNTLRIGSTETQLAATGRFVYLAYRYEVVAGTLPLRSQVVRETIDAAGVTHSAIIARDLDGTFAGPVFTCAQAVPAFTLGQPVTSATSQQVVTVSSISPPSLPVARVRVGTKLYVDYDNPDLTKRETVVTRMVPSGTAVKAVFTKDHASGANVALDSCPSVRVDLPVRSFFGTLMRTASVALRVQP